MKTKHAFKLIMVLSVIVMFFAAFLPYDTRYVAIGSLITLTLSAFADWCNI